MSAELIKTTELPAKTATPADLLQMAVSQGADLDKLEKLMDLQERWEKNEARKAYILAMTKFKQDAPEIFKDKHVSYKTDKGTTEYDHASLFNIVKQIGDKLAIHGLSHRWDIETLEGGIMVVTCVLTHKMGHSESVPMQAGADGSGGKNNIQAKGSTITYLQRYTLLAATGMATKEMDDDGRTAEPVNLITEDQSLSLHARLTENAISIERFLQHIKAQSLETIPVKAWEYVDGELNATIKNRLAAKK